VSGDPLSHWRSSSGLKWTSSSPTIPQWR
jgi:hypothetical protein